MRNLTEQEFIIEQQKAIERMKKLAENSSRGGNMPPTPHFVKTESKDTKGENSSVLPFDLSSLNIPFLDKLKNDKDIGLILGLILILVCENSDKLLLLALAYILL